REIYEFDSLLLKSGSEDFTRTIMRDELTTSLVDGTTTLFVQAYRPVTLYIDGEYWGIYYLRERLDEDYVEDHTGWDSSTVDVIKSLGELDAGSMTDFYDVRRFCNSHDMSVAENYEYACSRIDIDNVIDWYVCRSYFSDHDISNIRMFRSPDGDNKWHYMFYDLDWSLDPHFATEGSFTWIVEHTEDSFFQRLMLNATFRDKLLRRLAELRKTILNEEHIIAAIDHIADIIRPEIERDRVRWGIRQGKWQENLEELKDFFRNGSRDTAYMNDIKSFFGLSASQLISQYGFENVK
ncbi:MAG: CotH kinase family protein, partial [Clostridia bacterium]|nr:CotH kinase family protein [Clostridia bacterium]